jgi:O-acetyl-ADP-ribose deacetylase (regulator of RNase III)
VIDGIMSGAALDGMPDGGGSSFGTSITGIADGDSLGSDVLVMGRDCNDTTTILTVRMPIRIEVIDADITTLKVDAIVNAANESLLGGGGVDGAIHDAAGPGLLKECRAIGSCPTGEARLTEGYDLPAKYVIHTVGPVWRDGNHGEDQLLAACYRHSMSLALRTKIRSIAFPAISTGVYGFPMDRAAAIAAEEVQRFLGTYPEFDRVIFCCFGAQATSVYGEAVRRVYER